MSWRWSRVGAARIDLSGHGDRAAAALCLTPVHRERRLEHEPHTAFFSIGHGCIRPGVIRLRGPSRSGARRRWRRDGRAARTASGSHPSAAPSRLSVDWGLLELGGRAVRLVPRALDPAASGASLGRIRVGAARRWVAAAPRALGARLAQRRGQTGARLAILNDEAESLSPYAARAAALHLSRRTSVRSNGTRWRRSEAGTACLR